MSNFKKIIVQGAENCVDNSSDLERIQKMLYQMDQVIFQEKKKESDLKIENDIEQKSSHAEMVDNRRTLTLEREELQEIRSKMPWLLNQKRKIENDPRLKLKKLIHSMKVKNLVNNFARKISRNNVERDPVQYIPFEERINRTTEWNGIQINRILTNMFNIISILNTLVMLTLFSISIVFKQAERSSEITGIQIFGFVWLLIEMVVNFIRVSYWDGYHKLEKIREIAEVYFRRKFKIDMICLLALLVDIVLQQELTIIAKAVFILKGWDCLEKIQALETKLLKTSYRENRWGLVKILLTNFIIAHFLAVILIMISWLNTKQNWLSKVNAMQAPWIEQYCWAYYWGTTIMFTVGFGDISAVNHQEAMLITLIQAFTCIYLAYNINCVGTYITNINAENVEKQKKQKTLKHLSDKNNISEDLAAKISNYIEESANIKKNFNIQEDSAFISSLPQSIKTSFLRESNKKIFDSLLFFHTLTESTLLRLAEKIEMSITHPGEIIEKLDEQARVLILKQGSVGFCTKLSGSHFNKSVIDKVQVKKGESPILLSLQFINPLSIKNYELHSKEYSVLYTMDIDTIKAILKERRRDLEHYFYLRDKSKHIVDEFELNQCEFCESKHLKFRCPKLHYMSIVQEVIYKSLKSQKNNERKQLKRQKNNVPALFYLEVNKQIFSSDIDTSFSESLISQEQNQESVKLTKKSRKSSIYLLKRSMRRKRTETKIIEEAVSTMKNEIMVFLDNEHNWFWRIEADVIQDYQHYFFESNAKNLLEKYRRKGKKQKNRTKSFHTGDIILEDS